MESWFFEKRLQHFDVDSAFERIVISNPGQIWSIDLKSPSREPRLIDGSGRFFRSALSRDGTRLALAGREVVAIGDAASGTILQEFRLPRNEIVIGISFSPDGRRVATSGNASLVRLYDAERLEADGAPIVEEDRIVTFCGFSPDGTRFATAGADQTARIWRTGAGGEAMLSLRHGNEVTRVLFSRDGASLLTSSFEGVVQVWDAESGERQGPELRHMLGVLDASFSADERRIVSSSADGTTRVWDRRSGHPLTPPLRSAGRAWIAALDPTNRFLLSSSEDGTVRLWDLAATGQSRLPIPQSSGVQRVRFDRAGERVAGIAGGRGFGWDLNRDRGYGLDAAGALNDIAISPGGEFLATASKSGEGWILDAATGAAVAGPLRHGKALECCVFSPDGKSLLTAGMDASLRLWKVADGTEKLQIASGAPFVFKAAFSPDGARIAAASSDFRLRIFDAESGSALGVLPGNVVRPAHLAFSRDGRMLASCGSGFVAQVWALAPSQRVGPDLVHTSEISGLCFSPDGLRLATACLDGSARVWNVLSGEPLTPPFRHHAPVYDVQFRPDGAWLVSAGNDGCARFWQLLRADRDPNAWRALPELLSGQRLDAIRGFSRLTAEDAQARWRRYRGESKEERYAPLEKVLNWHNEEAWNCERLQIWDGAIRQLDRLIALRPSPSFYRRRASAHRVLGHTLSALSDEAQAAAWKAREALGALQDAGEDR